MINEELERNKVLEMKDEQEPKLRAYKAYTEAIISCLQRLIIQYERNKDKRKDYESAVQHYQDELKRMEIIESVGI